MAGKEIKALEKNSGVEEKSGLVTQFQYLDLGGDGKGCVQFDVLVVELSSWDPDHGHYYDLFKTGRS